MTLARRQSPFAQLVTLCRAVDRPFDDTLVAPATRAGSA